jgi:plasmid stability protein
MPSLTLRNIPEELLSALRTLSERERRSLNSELLVVMEAGIAAKAERLEPLPPGAELQARLWEDLCGAWEDERDADEIIEDIRSHRSPGRKVEL